MKLLQRTTAAQRGIIRQREESHVLPGPLSHFDVYLPCSPVAAAAPPAAATPLPWRGHETILLVDDEEMIRRLGSLILQRCGYRVLLAADGLCRPLRCSSANAPGST